MDPSSEEPPRLESESSASLDDVRAPTASLSCPSSPPAPLFSPSLSSQSPAPVSSLIQISTAPVRWSESLWTTMTTEVGGNGGTWVPPSETPASVTNFNMIAVVFGESPRRDRAGLARGTGGTARRDGGSGRTPGRAWGREGVVGVEAGVLPAFIKSIRLSSDGQKPQRPAPVRTTMFSSRASVMRMPAWTFLSWWLLSRCLLNVEISSTQCKMRAAAVPASAALAATDCNLQIVAHEGRKQGMMANQHVDVVAAATGASLDDVGPAARLGEHILRGHHHGLLGLVRREEVVILAPFGRFRRGHGVFVETEHAKDGLEDEVADLCDGLGDGSRDHADGPLLLRLATISSGEPDGQHQVSVRDAGRHRKGLNHLLVEDGHCRVRVHQDGAGCGGVSEELLDRRA
eukprot:TRINITY_DN1591_c0_g1_i1.p1 TRINITY_DN1591_c0_g1~~TRINITY_DN1591_c0_g1_i1.p1  ORF type:complete len:403 (-),score=41.08 TRINITY_DN1591_c0_g1_i1:360-1568(-)